MSIQDLPDELLILIFRPFAKIQEHDDPFESINVPSEDTTSNIRALASCSKVCVKWHTIVEPILYSTFTKPGITRLEDSTFLPDQDGEVSVVPPNRSLRLILRTIIERPHLAEDIKKLVLGSWIDCVSMHDGLWPLHFRVREPDPDIRQTYRKALGRLARHRGRNSLMGLLYWADFVDNALDGYEESELILLLLSAPNLRTLHLAQMPATQDWMIVGAGGLGSHLNEIRLGSVDRPQDVELLRLGMLITLPSLKALTL
jgi:hypothetical protein